MAASINVHSWSPHADCSALFLVTSSFAKLALYLLKKDLLSIANTPRGHEDGELIVWTDSLTSYPGQVV